jgi:hypothetical protein
MRLPLPRDEKVTCPTRQAGIHGALLVFEDLAHLERMATLPEQHDAYVHRKPGAETLPANVLSNGYAERWRYSLTAQPRKLDLQGEYGGGGGSRCGCGG